ncbi:MAG: hypothetical protein R3C18_18945 [Planctomycetaceae bacterium]
MSLGVYKALRLFIKVGSIVLGFLLCYLLAPAWHQSMVALLGKGPLGNAVLGVASLLAFLVVMITMFLVPEALFSSYVTARCPKCNCTVTLTYDNSRQPYRQQVGATSELKFPEMYACSNCGWKEKGAEL